MGAAGWVDDLSKRLAHLESISKPGDKTGARAPPYWLGGLFSPDAFVTASRQHVARALSCSLEELTLSLVVGAEGETSSAGEGDCICVLLSPTFCTARAMLLALQLSGCSSYL